MSDTTNTEELDRKFDTRVIAHSIRRGNLPPAEVDAWLEALPDDAENAVECTVRFVATVGDRGTSRRR